MIIDELLGFFGASVVATQYATQSIAYRFATDHEIVEKVRDEFNRVTQNLVGDEDVDRYDLLDEIVTVENCFDCEYLSWFISETLRI